MPKSVDEYIAAQPEASRATLETVRAAIRQALPQAQEIISYGMPAYKIGTGKAVLSFGGWKNHYSLYPASGKLMAAFKKELTPYLVNKATIQFPFAEPVPVMLIGAIAKFRAAELAGK